MVFNKWVRLTETKDKSYITFDELNKGEYDTPIEFVKEDVDIQIECGIINIPEYIKNSLNYQELWETIKDDYIVIDNFYIQKEE